MTVLRVENLSISYKVKRDWLRAVRDFHIQIEPGQVYGLVGESGSGKSTVASGIMRYLGANGRTEPSSVVEFMGENLVTKSRREMQKFWGAKIGLVPQNPGAALNPSIRVGEQVAEILRQHFNLSREEIRRRTIEAFERVQLADAENILKRYPHELSGGMQQRVVIAMALITSPQLLILDEPTTNLDVTTEATILDLVRNLMNEGDTGALYVTHNLGVVAQLCERVVVMYAGEIMADASVEQIFNHSIHPYTTSLIRSIPRAGQTKRDAALPSIAGHPPSLTNLPQGCVYAPRCPLAIAICHSDKPPLETLAGNRLVRCHRWHEIVDGLELPFEQQAGVESISTQELERENLLKVDNLTKYFPVPRTPLEMLRGVPSTPVRAVDGVNLSIQQGRTLGLVGESGSGKSTLSRLIIGLTDRTAGDIFLMGVEVQGDIQHRTKDTLAEMQMVFQNPQNSLNPYRTVRQTLERPLMTLRKMKRAEAEVEVNRLLEAVQLREEYADRYPDQLSGGEKQRVAIARAFASDPALIICDEAVSALDVSVQAAVLNLLAQLQEERDTAYLFISHDLAVVGYLADYIAVMYLGSLLEVGYARDMFSAPVHPYTEALISAIPVADPLHRMQPIRLHEHTPSARNIPSGCRFHTRCPRKIGAICEQQDPPWQDDGDGHFIHCHIPLEELVELQSATLNPVRKEHG
jgi:peptide/nickel transport system ATP-binding protein